ncbi:MAG: hypothetical protein AB8B73_02480 [Ekhidna sp.]
MNKERQSNSSNYYPPLEATPPSGRGQGGFKHPSKSDFITSSETN